MRSFCFLVGKVRKTTKGKYIIRTHLNRKQISMFANKLQIKIKDRKEKKKMFSFSLEARHTHFDFRILCNIDFLSLRAYHFIHLLLDYIC